jgi:hypothetical protein
MSYVTSLHSRAVLAHVGSGHRTACGTVLGSPFRVTATFPPGRTLCRRCGEEMGLPDPGGHGEQTDLLDAEIVGALLRGLDNFGVARELGLGLRTAVRYINAAQKRAGARNRFEWGHIVGQRRRA